MSSHDPDPALTAANKSLMQAGGPAFPQHIEGNHFGGDVHYHGMTLRDWFAGQALGSVDPWSVTEGDLVRMFGKTRSNISIPEIRAALAYAVADAMIKERSKSATPSEE